MDATTYTGTDEELDALVDGVGDEVDRQWRDNATFVVLDSAPFRAWRDAAVARFLAEAGAVHPKVHTPNRVQQWLGEHGWQAQAPTSHGLTAQWMRDGKRVFVPLRTDTADYARFAGYTISIGAEMAGARFQQALLEISALSDEVAW